MIKTLRKFLVLFFAFFVLGQGLSGQVGQLVGKAKASEDCGAQINISKTSEPSGNVAPDKDITYTITVTNTGTEDSGPMTLTDKWSFDSDVVASYVDGSATAGANLMDIANQTIYWHLDSVIVGVPQIFTFKLHTNATNNSSGTFTIRNSTCIRKFISTQLNINSDELNLCSEAINTVTYNAQLNITKVAEPIVAKPDQAVNYTVQIFNPGVFDAENVVIRDTISDSFSYVSGSARLDGVAQEPVVTGNVLEWQKANLVAGATSTLTYQIKIGSSVAAGIYPNTVVVSAENVEESPQAEAAVTVVKVIPPQVLGASTGPQVGQPLPQTGPHTSVHDVVYALFSLLVLLVGFSLRPNKLVTRYVK